MAKSGLPGRPVLQSRCKGCLLHPGDKDCKDMQRTGENSRSKKLCENGNNGLPCGFYKADIYGKGQHRDGNGRSERGHKKPVKASSRLHW